MHDVFLALAAQQTLRLGVGQRAAGLEIVKGDDLGADEAALKIGVDLARGLRGLGALLDGPGAAFVAARGQEGDEAQQLVAALDQPVQTDCFRPSSSMNMAFSSGASSSAMSASSFAQIGSTSLPSFAASACTWVK